MNDLNNRRTCLKAKSLKLARIGTRHLYRRMIEAHDRISGPASHPLPVPFSLPLENSTKLPTKRDRNFSFG
jgi:hypothetical protein